MVEDSLQCTVTELMETFRDAVRALLPTAERLQLDWRDGYEHRDWERLTAALFDVCVRGPIEVDAGRLDGEYPLPPYDIDVASYTAFSWIEGMPAQADRPAAFIRLTTDGIPFESAQFASLDPNGFVPAERTKLLLSDVEFVFVRRGAGSPPIQVREIMAIE